MSVINVKILRFIERRQNNIIGKHEYYDSNKRPNGESVPRDFYPELMELLKQFYDGDIYNNGIWITSEDLANTICIVMGITINYTYYQNHRVILGRPLLINNDDIFRNKIVFYNPFENVMGIIDDVKGWNER